MTHPFHPWHGREFVFVGVRQTWDEDRCSCSTRTDAAVAAVGLDGRGGAVPVRRRGGWPQRVPVVDLLAVAALLDGLRGAVDGDKL